MLIELFNKLLGSLTEATLSYYGRRLVALTVFGSVARGVPRADSDVDILVVADELPFGRIKRVEEFESIERALADTFTELTRHGITTRLSPIFKTRYEVEAGSPLFLDMTEDARILYDKGNFLANYLETLRRKLEQLGAKRIWRGNMWYWDLKPDYKKGETFVL